MNVIDILVVIGVLLLTLVIGIKAGRGIKDINNFAVGNRSYGTWALFCTLSASYIGGGYTFGISEKTFQFGIVYILCLIGFSLQQFFVATVLAPKMTPFNKAISVGDIMGKFYGKIGKVLTGIASVAVCAGIIGAQVTAMGYVFQIFLGIKQVYGILIGCSIVIAYSVFGGMQSVVATDILQFVILIVVIPLTLIIGVYYAGGIDNIISKIPDTHLKIPGKMPVLTMISLFLSFLFGEALVPPYVQRLFITNNVKTTKRGTLYSSIMSVPFFAIAGGIGLVALTRAPNINPNLSLPSVVEILPIGIKGLAISGIIAVIMSSADSYLNASAIAVVNDVIRPYNTKMTSKKELSLTRLFTFLIGGLAIIFAININSAMDILLYSYNFWSPVILVPFCAGILGFKIKINEFIITTVVAISAVILWNVFLGSKFKVDGLVIGVIANFILFISFIFFGRKTKYTSKTN